MGLIEWFKKPRKHIAHVNGRDERFTNILQVERDICHLYHLLSGYEGAPGQFPCESLDFEAIYTLPYWEYLRIDLDEVDLERRDFLREGCLVMIYEMACASTEPEHAHLKDKLSLCRDAISEMDLGVQRIRDLARVVLDAINAAAEASPRMTESMAEDASFLLHEYVIPYFRKRGRRIRAPLFFKENDPVKVEREKMDWHAREAEKAYEQLYSANTGTEAAAAYSDCKEHMADAIALAQKTGLDEKVLELERKLEHYKAVFRSQFG